ncbi:MAG: DUF294 nucleotidyltransferase-like domain-containing protein [Casimicrobiaceae bacterium]|nr:DUF294 nucleotidyltransferase-like domain-containing protein [Casimicrobiaceae bacterium]
MQGLAAVEPYLELLRSHEPFSGMSEAECAEFFARARVSYHPPGEVLLPAGVAAEECWIVLSGRVRGERQGNAAALAIELVAGEMFPVGAILTGRPTISRFHAEDEVFALRIPAQDFIACTRTIRVLADFCDQRLSFLLERSQRALSASYALEGSAEQMLPRTLGQLLRRQPISVGPEASIEEALTLMQEHAIGSVLVVDDERRPVGIFTERDLVPRVVLAKVPIERRLVEVASQPVVTLSTEHTAVDAALLMAERGFRHIAVTDREGRLRGVVSERDLFALQRHSLTGLSGAIRRASSLEQLIVCARDARELAKNLIAQGVQPLTMTQFVSRLNDQIVARLLDTLAPRHGIDAAQLCWIALGSEGRHEQTISTDQDNALILADGSAQAALSAFAREANDALDACGFPRCKGNLMAGNPEFAQPLQVWRERFAGWIDRGSPQALLAANIFFDLRPLWGNAALAETLRTEVLAQASSTPRFLKQLAHNALETEPPLNWLGNIAATETIEGRQVIDLKRYGIRPFVDGARVLALACAEPATNTAQRLTRLAQRGLLPEVEARTWVDAFGFLQGLRLRLQQAPAFAQAPNALPLDTLSTIDARILKECFRQARKLQQRLRADYP